MFMLAEITDGEYVEIIRNAAKIVEQAALTEKGYKEQAYRVVLSYLLDELESKKHCFSADEVESPEREVSDESQPESW